MSGLVDYFAVCGLQVETLEKEQSTGLSYTPPLSRSFQPKVLCRYPKQDRVSNPFDENAITTLCMPDGLRFKKNLQDHTHKYIHTFCITRENGQLLYGTALTYYELTVDVQILNNFESLQNKYYQKIKARLNTSKDNFTRGKDQLYVPKSLCFVTPQPIFRPLKMYLEQLYAVTIGQVSCELPVSSYLYNILFEISLPGPGKILKFKGPLGKFHLSFPSSTELPMCDYSFRQFFELLGVKNIVRLLRCLFLEHQVLIKSADLERLSMVAHCARALMWPFTWPHVFVPFLPSSQRVFLDAPVPYLMGLRVDPGSQENKMCSELTKVVSLCIVELDSERVHFPEDLPPLPDESRLVLNLSRIISEHNVVVPDTTNWPYVPPSPSDRAPPPLTSKTSIHDTIELAKEISKNNKKIKMSGSSLINPNHNMHSTTERLLSPTLSVDEGAFDMEFEEQQGTKQWNYIPDRSDTSFSLSIREAFVEFFVESLMTYDKFIIVPSQDLDQWQKNREQFQNFDKTAYLSDQPANSKPFFSAFMETSIFSMFVDDKIVALKRPELCSNALRLFDTCISRHREHSGLANPPRTPGYRNNSISSESEDDVIMDEHVLETAPPPHVLSPPKTVGLPSNSPPNNIQSLPSSPPPAGFPFVNPDLLKLPSNPRDEQCSPPPLSSSRSPVADRIKRNPDVFKNLFSAHSHAKFVSQLMRETRLRVKHMLGSSRESESLIEENTHIAYLCDLLERIFGHGIRKRENQSPLWSHLMAYAETVGRLEFREALGMNSSSSSPPPPLATSPSAAVPISRPRSASLSSSTSLTTTYKNRSGPISPAPVSGSASPRPSPGGIRSHFRKKTPELRSKVEAILHPSPSSLITDLLVVHNMHELKTDVGRARGWVRLALEKKALSRHLRELFCHDHIITNSRYREYAFIRTEDEREQFLYHLLTLTAREFSCFTSAFVHTTMTYQVLVVAEGKRFGLSTSSLYLDLSGDFMDTGRIQIPRGELETTLECENIGELRCLRLGHDNSGMAPSLYVECVLVHNVTTGQTYMASCGHFLGKADEDGSVERFMVVHKVPQTLAKTGINMSILEVASVLPASPSGRRRDSRVNTEEDATLRQIMLDLKQIMDKIRTTALSKKPDKREMLRLIHSDSGFTKCMELVLDAGFKTSRKFSRKLHFWDLLERINSQFSSEDMAMNELSAANAYHRAGNYDSTYYCHEHELSCRDLFQKALAKINENTSIGKDEKVMKFLCLGLRDHLLRDWLGLVAGSPALPTFYEPKSFLRDSVLLQNLMDTFQLTLSLPINLEPLFIQGL